MERYEKIMSISGSLLQENCPVIFEKGALLKDNKLGKNVLQLQFRNISLKMCKAVYISINCLDVENKYIETVEKKYLDIAVTYKNVFGENQPIELSSALSRNYQFKIEKVIFADDTIVECSGQMFSFNSANKLDELGDLKSQFVREVSENNRKTRCSIKPTELNGLWYCTCGALNYGDNDKCGVCAIGREKLFALLDIEYLKAQNEEYLKQKEIEENERKLQEEQRAEELRLQDEARKEKHKKNMKITAIVVIIAILLGVVYGIFVNFVVPAIKYSSAIEAIENENYEEGYQILTELGDYKDSEEQIKKGKYKQALEYVKNRKYEEGIALLQELGKYSDARGQIVIAKYAAANDAFDVGNYEEAVKIYDEIAKYSDSKEKLKEARYRYAKELMEGEKYFAAYEQFLKIINYADSHDLCKECTYNYAEECVNKNNYIDAITYYKIADSYLDAPEKVDEAKYRYVKANFSCEDDRTVEFMDELVEKGYKDSKELSKELYELKVTITVNSSSTDGSYNEAYLSKYKNWYFHVFITNGDRKKNYDLKYTLKFPDGGIERLKGEQLRVGSHDVFYGYYSQNSHLGATGTATAKVYDSSGNFLAEKSVQIY